MCRELTKRFEEVVRGTAAELAAHFAQPPKGEVTLVLGAGVSVAGDVEAAVEAVRLLVEAGAARRVAADVVSGLVQLPRNALYRGSLERAD